VLAVSAKKVGGAEPASKRIFLAPNHEAARLDRFFKVFQAQVADKGRRVALAAGGRHRKIAGLARFAIVRSAELAAVGIFLVADQAPDHVRLVMPLTQRVAEAWADARPHRAVKAAVSSILLVARAAQFSSIGFGAAVFAFDLRALSFVPSAVAHLSNDEQYL